MGFGKLLTRSVEYTVSDTGAPGISQTFSVPNGIDPSWDSANYRGAMGIPACWRAANMLSGLLGLLPWHLYEENDGVPTTRLPTPLLLTDPNPEESRIEALASLALDYFWEGNAIAIIAAIDPETGEPTALAPQPAELIAVRRSPEDNRVKYRVYTPDDTYGQSRRYTEWDQDEILHIKGPHKPGALRGMGVLEAHFHGAVTLARTQNRQALDVVRNSGVPTGLLTTESEDVTADELKEGKESWLQSQRERTIAALGWGTKFQAVSWNPEEQQLLEARSFSLTEVELLFGLPVGWLGGMNSARQYSNIEQDAINLLKFTLGDPLARFEQALGKLYPPGRVVQADLDEISRADTLTRAQGYELAIKNKWMAPSEVRPRERLAPMTAAQKSEIKEMTASEHPQPQAGAPGRTNPGAPAKLQRVK